MIINTMYFGEVEVNESSVIHFDEGLSGFEGLKRYVVLESSEDASPIKWLQSVEDSNTALPIMNPFEAKHDYEFEIDSETKSSLNINDPSEVVVCSVVTVPDKVTRMTTNLKSPIIINLSNNKGRQMVMHSSSYDTQHYVLDEMVTGTFVKLSNSDNK